MSPFTMSVVCAKIYFHVLFITITGNYSLTTHQHYCTTKSCRAGFVQVLCCWLGERCAVSPLLATTVTPSMAVNKKPYKTWAAVVKDSAQCPGGDTAPTQPGNY